MLIRDMNEDQVSDLFDSIFKDELIKLFDRGDRAWINAMFSDWTDGLTKDGEMTQEQYQNFCYNGKYEIEYI